MSTTEEQQSTPAETPATEVRAPAQEPESMDTTPEPAKAEAAPATTPSADTPLVASTESTKTEPSQNVAKVETEKFIRPAQPVIKPPVPKTIQTDRPSKQSIEQMEEAKYKAKFGGLQKPGGSQFLQKRLNKGMKYFDSGDYNMAKQSGKLNRRPLSGKPGIPPAPNPTGEAIPTPDSIHHRKPSSEISKLAV